MATSARVLALLSLLQSRTSWAGHELAARLEVSPRTLRRDITALQELGYPIVTTRGTGGGYRLETGAALPPLVVTEEEAAAIVLGLREIAAGAGPLEAQSAITALTKTVEVLPGRVRRRIESLRHVTQVPLSVPTSRIDVSVLTTLAIAVRDRQTVAIGYADRQGAATTRELQPHELLSFEHRIYLVAYDLLRSDWRLFRVDRVNAAKPTGRAFARRPLPYDDSTAYLTAQLSRARSEYDLRATVHAPEGEVSAALQGYATVTPLSDSSCEVRMAVDRLEWAAFALGSLHASFELHGPAEASRYLREWGERFLGATTSAPTEDRELPG